MHEIADNLLQSTSSASPVLHTTLASDETILPSADQQNTFFVRPSTVFACESDPDYLEQHYLDLFPFGRGGFGEKRKNRISRRAYLLYLLNLSTRQFQNIDFILHLYDMTIGQELANKVYMRSKLPSRGRSSDRTVSKSELFKGFHLML